jgi:ribonuclease-3
MSEFIKNIFGFYPKNIFLYKLAFRHKSVAKEIQEGAKNSNERLEFLGDAILGTVVTDYLFRIYPFKDEGFLTQLRSKLVSRDNLNKLGQTLDIDSQIEIDNSIHNHSSSIIGNAVEALVGAIYLDKGYKFTYKVLVEKVFNGIMDIQEIQDTEINFKSKLIEWSQKEKKEVLFKAVNTQGSGNNISHQVNLYIDDDFICKSSATSIKKAEQSASKIACQKLGLNGKTS